VGLTRAGAFVIARASTARKLSDTVAALSKTSWRFAVQTLKTIAIATVLGIAASGTAVAAEKCSQKSFAGVWMMSSTAPSLCLFELNSKGDVTESRCYLAMDFQNPAGTLSGKLQVSSKCRITGDLTEAAGKKKVTYAITATGTASPLGNVIEGTAKAGKKTSIIAGWQQW
jgi:hypothetical protein